MRFTKMHGCGNDYVYVDCFRQPLPPDPPGLSRVISDRHFGVGGDGLILICPSTKADARMRMYNAAGREFARDYWSPAADGEALVLPHLVQELAPVVVTDHHGFPNHEWTQPYSGYLPPRFASFWLPRAQVYAIVPAVATTDGRRLAAALVEELRRRLAASPWADHNQAWRRPSATSARAENGYYACARKKTVRNILAQCDPR